MGNSDYAYVEEALRLLYEFQVGNLPAVHRARTPDCLPIPRFDRYLQRTWTPAQKAHIEKCEYCTRMNQYRAFLLVENQTAASQRGGFPEPSTLKNTAASRSKSPVTALEYLYVLFCLIAIPFITT